MLKDDYYQINRDYNQINPDYFYDTQTSENQNNKLNDSKISIDRQWYGFKVILIGDINVGKTTIFSQFSNRKNSKANQTFGNTTTPGFAKVSIIFEDSNSDANLHIWDTSGEERYKTVTQQFYKDIDGCFIVFDLGFEKTFDNLDKWISDVKDNAPDNVEIMLIGNKCDLQEENKIDSKKPKDFASERNLPYYEVSALNNYNIKFILETLTKQMMVLSDVMDDKKKNNNEIKTRKKNNNEDKYGRISLCDNDISSITIVENIKKKNKKCC